MARFTAIDIRARMAMANIAPSKSVNRFALTDINLFIHEAGRTHAVLQVGDEPSCKP